MRALLRHLFSFLLACLSEPPVFSLKESQRRYEARGSGQRLSEALYLAIWHLHAIAAEEASLQPCPSREVAEQLPEGFSFV
jgi:hypothetical protein